ncbi:FecR family protein [Pedobacter nyackensis]|uniref:FecR family protein n=1 Tax=Pedobacter nyackensis TaxID=475255 RepID=A0A1W2D2Q3_9SPHI|nr:FecR domain-containing protein [Pedobacter nyackensis]SMC91875.1 FecR family protein [Pedobacter nyackensis]
MELPNINNNSRIADLISGYLFNDLNGSELKELEQWIEASIENKELFESVLDESSLENQGRIYAAANVGLALINIKQQLSFVEMSEINTHRKIKLLWVRISVAASILLICTIGVHYLTNSRISGSSKDLAKQNEINPGSNKATLTLANGKKIILSAAVKGELAHEAGVVITKADDGMLVYEIKAQNERDNHKMNTLSTANGEQYQVNLPDGTKVWLNAATSLKYPTSFSGTRKREVELSGEAYFEVAKDKAHPFIVTTNRQSVEVLGTHFNVSSYSDESITKTTLLEGSVKINGSIQLRPGEQGILAESAALVVRKVDTENSVAWKNGLFIFDNEVLKTAMNKIARWYDVEVQYQDRNLELLTVGGSISRFDKISEVLSLFEKAGSMQFTIKGRTIIISNKK